MRRAKVIWATLVDGAVRVGDLEAAEGIMAEMRAARCAPNDYIFNSLLRGYCGQGGRSPDVSVTSVLLCFR